MILSAELMLHGVSLTLTTFCQAARHNEGQVFTIFILTVAACEAGLGAVADPEPLPEVAVAQHRPVEPVPRVGPPRSAVAGRTGPAPLSESSYENLPKLTPAGRPLELSRGDRKETATNV